MEEKTISASRRTRTGSDDLRRRLVEAATAEFAEQGFDGASGRSIAARAGAHQPQINYHFKSKTDLWKAVVDELMGRFDLALRPLEGGDHSSRSLVEAAIRGAVTFAAANPELGRIVVHEGTKESDRLAWLVDTHLRSNYQALSAVWDELRASGQAAPIDAVTANYFLLGMATSVYTSAPEARLLADHDPFTAQHIAAHADAVVALLLPAPQTQEPLA